MEHEQPPVEKLKTILSFFKPIDESNQNTSIVPFKKNTSIVSVQSPPIPNNQSIVMERDPGKRKKISQYPLNLQDKVRRAYIKVGPYQPILKDYPKKMCGENNRKFQSCWFKKYPWLEYSPTKDKAYCFPCFLFFNDRHGHNTSALVYNGFSNWKRANGKDGALVGHVGRKASSSHVRCTRSVENLMTKMIYVDKECVHRRRKSGLLSCRVG